MWLAVILKRMNYLQALFLVAAGICVAPTVKSELFCGFRKIVLCEKPNTNIIDYLDYGCYCGWGGSGTPVDDLDRCCQAHDKCYEDAVKHRACWKFWDHPYTEIYDFTCDKKNKSVTCTERNNKCEKFICECDRKAGECFAESKWNPDHAHLPSERCE